MVSLAENDSREAEKRVVAAPVGEWFRLRIEYGVTDVDGELTLTVRAFVNGEAVYESCEPWVRGGSTEKPVIKPDIDGIQIYGLSNRNGTVYIDNVTFDKPDNVTE